jgi:hypothetical protein
MSCKPTTLPGVPSIHVEQLWLNVQQRWEQVLREAIEALCTPSKEMQPGKLEHMRRIGDSNVANLISEFQVLDGRKSHFWAEMQR